PEILLLGVRRHLAPLDPAANTRGSNDGDVLEVPRADRLRESPRHGGVDGDLPGRRAVHPGRAKPRGARPPRRLLLARRVSPAPRPDPAQGPQLQSAGGCAGAGARLMGVLAYLRNIKDAAFTIADGMAVTASHLVRKPFTIQYPDRLPDGVRVQDTL